MTSSEVKFVINSHLTFVILELGVKQSAEPEGELLLAGTHSHPKRRKPLPAAPTLQLAYKTAQLRMPPSPNRWRKIGGQHIECKGRSQWGFSLPVTMLLQLHRPHPPLWASPGSPERTSHICSDCQSRSFFSTKWILEWLFYKHILVSVFHRQIGQPRFLYLLVAYF